VLWRYASGQATGSAHAKTQKASQDRAACVTVDADATLIAVVADGAGTASLAQVGAEIAVATVSSIALLGARAGRRDFGELLREGATLARQRLVEAAADQKSVPRDLACTLLAAIVSPLGGAALQIGDGVIVVGEQALSWRWVFWPQNGEYANSTFFLSDERALRDAAVADLSDNTLDIALMTDGVEPLALHFASRTAHEPFFKSVFAPLHAKTASGEATDLSQGLANMLGSAPVQARTDDDTTLVLATRRAQA
jgi:Protein phosphatase 2C